MRYTLKIPLFKDYNSWFNFINKHINDGIYEEIEELVVDFNSVSFLETNHMVMLGCLMEYKFNDTCKVSFKGGTDTLNGHLDNIRFKEYWSKDFDRKKFTISRNNSTLCLWQVSEKMIYSYTHYAKDYFQKTFASQRDLLPISHNLAEIFNNIFDHADSPVQGYVITQFYPKNKKLSFCVCDFGIGIADSVNRFRKSKKDKEVEDWKAISIALEDGYSVGSTPRNRGMGLRNLLELTEDSNGKLTIYSNNGFVEKQHNQAYRMNNTQVHFQGTLIRVDVDISTFDEEDTSEETYTF